MTTDYDVIVIGSDAGTGAGTVRIKILPQHMKALRAEGASRLQWTLTS